MRFRPFKAARKSISAIRETGAADEADNALVASSTKSPIVPSSRRGSKKLSFSKPQKLKKATEATEAREATVTTDSTEAANASLQAGPVEPAEPSEEPVKLASSIVKTRVTVSGSNIKKTSDVISMLLGRSDDGECAVIDTFPMEQPVEQPVEPVKPASSIVKTKVTAIGSNNKKTYGVISMRIERSDDDEFAVIDTFPEEDEKSCCSFVSTFPEKTDSPAPPADRKTTVYDTIKEGATEASATEASVENEAPEAQKSKPSSPVIKSSSTKTKSISDSKATDIPRSKGNAAHSAEASDQVKRATSRKPSHTRGKTSSTTTTTDSNPERQKSISVSKPKDSSKLEGRATSKGRTKNAELKKPRKSVMGDTSSPNVLTSKAASKPQEQTNRETIKEKQPKRKSVGKKSSHADVDHSDGRVELSKEQIRKGLHDPSKQRLKKTAKKEDGLEKPKKKGTEKQAKDVQVADEQKKNTTGTEKKRTKSSSSPRVQTKVKREGPKTTEPAEGVMTSSERKQKTAPKRAKSLKMDLPKDASKSAKVKKLRCTKEATKKSKEGLTVFTPSVKSREPMPPPISATVSSKDSVLADELKLETSKSRSAKSKTSWKASLSRDSSFKSKGENSKKSNKSGTEMFKASSTCNGLQGEARADGFFHRDGLCGAQSIIQASSKNDSLAEDSLNDTIIEDIEILKQNTSESSNAHTHRNHFRYINRIWNCGDMNQVGEADTFSTGENDDSVLNGDAKEQTQDQCSEVSADAEGEEDSQDHHFDCASQHSNGSSRAQVDGQHNWFCQDNNISENSEEDNDDSYADDDETLDETLDKTCYDEEDETLEDDYTDGYSTCEDDKIGSFGSSYGDISYSVSNDSTCQKTDDGIFGNSRFKEDVCNESDSIVEDDNFKRGDQSSCEYYHGYGEIESEGIEAPHSEHGPHLFTYSNSVPTPVPKVAEAEVTSVDEIISTPSPSRKSTSKSLLQLASKISEENAKKSVPLEVKHVASEETTFIGGVKTEIPRKNMSAVEDEAEVTAEVASISILSDSIASPGPIKKESEPVKIVSSCDKSADEIISPPTPSKKSTLKSLFQLVGKTAGENTKKSAPLEVKKVASEETTFIGDVKTEIPNNNLSTINPPNALEIRQYYKITDREEIFSGKPPLTNSQSVEKPEHDLGLVEGALVESLGLSDLIASISSMVEEVLSKDTHDAPTSDPISSFPEPEPVKIVSSCDKSTNDLLTLPLPQVNQPPTEELATAKASKKSSLKKAFSKIGKSSRKNAKKSVPLEVRNNATKSASEETTFIGAVKTEIHQNHLPKIDPLDVTTPAVLESRQDCEITDGPSLMESEREYAIDAVVGDLSELLHRSFEDAVDSIMDKECLNHQTASF